MTKVIEICVALYFCIMGAYVFSEGALDPRLFQALVFSGLSMLMGFHLFPEKK